MTTEALKPGTKFYMNSKNDVLMNHGYALFVGKRLTVLQQRKDGLYEVNAPDVPNHVIVLKRANMDVCHDQD